MADGLLNRRRITNVQYSRVTDHQSREIHGASLEILGRFGIKLHDPEAIKILKKGGADIVDDNIVKVPFHMVNRALSTVPKEVVLYNRYREAVMPLRENYNFYGPGSDTLNIIDHRTGERRKPILKDVEEGSILCDALDNIHFLMSMVLPTDVDQTRADSYQAATMLLNSAKPVIAVSYEVQGLVDAVQMAETIAGDADALRKKPFITSYINVVSGRNHNPDALQKLIFLARKGLPSIYIPSSTSGIVSPITPAGAIAFDNAGVLLGIVLSQLVREGAPFIMPGMYPTPMDMRTMVSTYFDPQHGLWHGLARLYQLPTFGIGGYSDSKLPDQQASAEAGMSLLADSVVGSNIIHNLGYLESGLTYSFAQLAMCEEIVGWIKKFVRGIDVSEETLALDVIEQIGPEGSFLNSDHTLRHFREMWDPVLIDRDSFQKWEEKGSTTMVERAAGRVEEILSSHVPPEIDDSVRERVWKVVDETAGEN